MKMLTAYLCFYLIVCQLSSVAYSFSRRMLEVDQETCSERLIHNTLQFLLVQGETLSPEVTMAFDEIEEKGSPSLVEALYKIFQDDFSELYLGVALISSLRSSESSCGDAYILSQKLAKRDKSEYIAGNYEELIYTEGPVSTINYFLTLAYSVTDTNIGWVSPNLLEQEKVTRVLGILIDGPDVTSISQLNIADLECALSFESVGEKLRESRTSIVALVTEKYYDMWEEQFITHNYPGLLKKLEHFTIENIAQLFETGLKEVICADKPECIYNECFRNSKKEQKVPKVDPDTQIAKRKVCKCNSGPRCVCDHFF